MFIVLDCSGYPTTAGAARVYPVRARTSAEPLNERVIRNHMVCGACCAAMIECLKALDWHKGIYKSLGQASSANRFAREDAIRFGNQESRLIVTVLVSV